MIIDFHTHCFPDDLAQRAMKKLSQNSSLSYYHNGTVNGLKEVAKKAKIDKCIVLPIATKPEQTQTINRWVKSIQDECIISFGTIHPKYQNWQDEINWLKENNFKGIKFHPDYQDFFVDSKEMFPIYDAIIQCGMIMIFHCGVDVAFNPPYHCTPDRLINLLNEFQDAKIVAAHMGGYRFFSDVQKYLIGKNVYLDTSFFFGEEYVGNIEDILKKHGIEKILFATDSPWKDQAREIEYIRNLRLTDDEKDMILGKNAMRLLELNN
ncbi:amidohydrolase family protein [Caldicellulosiruptoraceae bacterium PP1]